MLDLGFLPALRRVVASLPRSRQTLLFSATLSEAVVALAAEFTRDPARVDVSGGQAVAPTVTHHLHRVEADQKRAALTNVLTEEAATRALVFCKTKRGSDRVGEHLERAGIRTAVIHGNKSQGSRTRALADFKAGRVTVLVATDIAARGIDVEALGHVVNFDVPNMPEDYIHRVGRTARAEMTGDAFTFVSPAEESDMQRIERAIGKRLPRITVPDFNYKARPESRLELSNSERRAIARARNAGERKGQGQSRNRRSSGGSAGKGRSPSGDGNRGRPSSPPGPARSKAPSRRPRRSRRKGRSW
jgi:ATP-dependent RNA helicase RhlE